VLSEDEKQYLYDKVIDPLRVGEPRQVLVGYNAPAELIDRISNSFNTPALFTTEVIRLCIDDRWNHTPCWLLCLFPLFPEEPRSATLKARLANPPAHEGDPARRRVMDGDIPFLNRDTLRSRAVQLGADRAARPILHISGGERSGKSYSYDFLYHLFTSKKVDFVPFRVQFRKDFGLLIGPEQLAKEILMGMGVQVDQLPPSFFGNDTNNVRWLHDLAGRILAKRPVGKRFWIILDNFFGDSLLTETAKFIDALALRIADSAELAQNFRLVLLQFDRTHLSVESRKVDRETISEITDQEVQEAAREIYGRYRGTPDEPLLQGTVTQVLEGMAARKDLALLNERLQALIDSLRN